MKRKLFFVVMMLSAFFMMEMQAQEFSLKGEFRPRMEFRNGYKTLLSSKAPIAGMPGHFGKISPALFVSQRSRLNFNYKSDDVKVGFSLQNVGVWGETKNLSSSDINGFQVHEAWGQFKLFNGVELKVGRQEIVYDDHRIFGSVNWAQQGRSHDAAVLKLSPMGGKCKIDLGFAFNANGESLFGEYYDVAKNYRTLQYLHYHRDFGKLGLSVLALNNGMPNSIKELDGNDTIHTEAISFSQTIGSRLTYKAGKLKANAAFYYQMGDLSKYTAADFSIEAKQTAAMYAAADIAYSIKGLSVGAGFEYLSGTDMDADPSKASSTFNPIYGTNHKFNGWMDYFYVGNPNSTGLMDIYVPIKYKFNKTTIGATYHNFSATAKVIDANGEMNASLGSEIDFSIAHPISKSVIFKAGYSYMMATNTMKVVKKVSINDASSNGNWAWMMLVIKPTFFSK